MTRNIAIGGMFVTILIVLAIVGPMVAPDRLIMLDPLNGAFASPSHLHWLGTDQFSRDIFARLARGARVSLTIATLAVLVAAVIGCCVGLMAGTANRVIATIGTRLIDIGLSLPRVVVLLVLLTGLGALSVPALGVVLGVTGWPGVARIVRGETLRLRSTAFVAAAEALGATPQRIAWREILPGTIPAVLIATTLGIADAILLEAGLSFIGLGIRPPEPSWGGMISEAREHLASAPWLLLAPCAALVLATSAATLLGEAFRLSLQPDTR